MIKIYKLIYNNEIVYVGQTKQKLNRRKGMGYGKNEQLDMISKKCSIELIEETDDISRERYWIDLLRSEGHPLLNKRGGDGLDKKEYRKEYREKNKEEIKEYQNEYALRENRKEYVKEWREKNKEYNKEWREKNKEKIKEYFKEYYLKKKLLKDTSR
jgi:hypothetical protein